MRTATSNQEQLGEFAHWASADPAVPIAGCKESSAYGELCNHIMRGCVGEVAFTPSTLVVKELGPRAAQQRLCRELTCAKDKSDWMVDAELRAILGGMQGSLKSLASGLRCYIAFVGMGHVANVLAACDRFVCAAHMFPSVSCFFPPSREILLAWSTLFRCGGTFKNYLNFVKTGCIITRQCTEVRVFAAHISTRRRVFVFARFSLILQLRRRRPASSRRGGSAKGSPSG